MTLERIEYNVASGEREVIDQTAYKNQEGDILVLDSIEPTPDGYEVFDPAEVDDTEELE